MVKIILGIIAGFVVWSLLWVGSDSVLAAISPDWYGRQIADLDTAAVNKTPYLSGSLILIIALIRSVIISAISGYTAAFIAGENYKSTLGLGILLLLFGTYVQSVYWDYAPLWYHLTFLILLIPVTVAGGKLRFERLLTL